MRPNAAVNVQRTEPSARERRRGLSPDPPSSDSGPGGPAMSVKSASNDERRRERAGRMTAGWPPSARVPIRLAMALGVSVLAAACSSGGGQQAPGTPAGNSTANGPAVGTVIATHSGPGGTYLTNGAGRAVYLWTADNLNKSACSGACAAAWPPVPAEGKVTVTGHGKASDLGTITRPDGTTQVTYDGHPLYVLRRRLRPRPDQRPGQRRLRRQVVARRPIRRTDQAGSRGGGNMSGGPAPLSVRGTVDRCCRHAPGGMPC